MPTKPKGKGKAPTLGASTWTPGQLAVLTDTPPSLREAAATLLAHPHIIVAEPRLVELANRLKATPRDVAEYLMQEKLRDIMLSAMTGGEDALRELEREFSLWWLAHKSPGMQKRRKKR